MKCKECIKCIIQEGEISPSIKERVEAHIAQCDDCREALHSSREIAGLLVTIGTVARDDVYWDNLFRNIRSARMGYKAARERYQPGYSVSGMWDRFFKPALTGFAFGLILLISYIYVDLQNEGFFGRDDVTYAAEDMEFLISEHSLNESETIFTQEELTLMYSSTQKNGR
ncbi:zf-HC2 domain-containing protein [bacterium]|nr:zf-HC2 domain-containing protein [bacterium]